MAEVREFDLSHLDQVWSKRTKRLLALGSGVGLCLLGLAGLAYDGARGRWDLVVVPLPVCEAVGLLLLVAYRYRIIPGASHASVGPEGVTFNFRPGLTRRWEWMAPGVGAKLMEATPEMAAGLKVPSRFATDDTWNVPSTFLTAEAFEAILASARGAGLEVVSGPEPFSGGRITGHTIRKRR